MEDGTSNIIIDHLCFVVDVVVVERSGVQCSSRQILDPPKERKPTDMKDTKTFLTQDQGSRNFKGTYYKNLLDPKIRKPFRSNNFGGKPFLREIANLEPRL